MDEIKYMCVLIDFALKNNSLVQIVNYGESPYEEMMGIRINGFTLGPFGWEAFEDPIDDEDKQKVHDIIYFIKNLTKNGGCKK